MDKYTQIMKLADAHAIIQEVLRDVNPDFADNLQDIADQVADIADQIEQA